MPFEKGHKKAGGKKKGSENNLTRQTKEMLLKILSGQTKYVNDALQKLQKDDPAKFIDAYAKLIGYIIARKSDVTSDDKPLQTITIDFTNDIS